MDGHAYERDASSTKTQSVFLKNVLDLPKISVNEVKAMGTEIRMNNIQNRRTDQDK